MRYSTVAVLLSLSLAAVARSDDTVAKDDWRWDAARAWRPGVGARWSEEKEILTKSSDKAILPGASDPYAEESSDLVSYKAVLEVNAVGEDGVVTDQTIKLERWSLKSAGEDPDTCLAGKTIRVTGAGKERAWAFTPDPAPAGITPDARRWITAYLLHPESDGESEECLFSKEPIASGASWTCDPVTVAAALYPGVEIDAKKSKVSGKLTQVHLKDGVHFGHYEIKVSLRLAKSPDGMEWKDALEEISIVFDGSLERDRSPTASVTRDLRFSGKGSVKGKDAGDFEEKAQTTVKAKIGSLARKKD